MENVVNQINSKNIQNNTAKLSAKIKKHDEINFMHINIGGLNCKFTEFSVLLENSEPNVLGVSEHWFLNNDIEQVKLNGYKLISHSSRSEYIRGGTAVYVQENMCFSDIVINCKSVEKVFEFSVCEVNVADLKITCICVYRSPKADFNQFYTKLDTLLQEVYSPGKFVVLLGDFNVHFLRVDTSASDLNSLLSSYGLISHITGITRPSSGTQVDNIFSNINLYDVKGSIYYADISDHYGQILSVKVPVQNHRSNHVKKRFFTDDNIFKFNNYLRGESWHEIDQVQGVNGKYNCFDNILRYYFDLSFPVKVAREGKNHTWVNREVKQYSMYIKDLYVTYQITKNPASLIHYKLERKAYRKFLVDIQKDVNHNKILASKNRTKTLWNIFNKTVNKNKSRANISLKAVSGELIKDPQEVADLLLTHFTSSIGNLNYRLKNSGENFPSMFLYPTDCTEIFKTIMNLPNKFSAGLDEIPTYVLKCVAEFICKPIALIVNESFREGIFPNELKKAKLVPIYKKGNRHVADNYRPISLLSSVSKVFERVIYDRLLEFINKNNVLSEQQYGFRPKRSTEIAIYNTLSYIFEKLDCGEKVAGLCFDLSKAFDTIHHEVLKSRLAHYGIRGVVLDLMVSYLTGRSQIVCIENDGTRYYSKWGRTELGVPQGSILGPTLFLLYVNGLAGGVGVGRVCQYADDTSVVLADPSLSGLAGLSSCAAGAMADWCHDNHLLLNLEKTGLITFCKQRNTNMSIYVKINHKSIPVAESIKFLGVTLDSTLSWEQHIRILTSRLASMCALVRRLRNTVSTDSFKVFYFSSIQSIITYGIIFWGSSTFAIKVFRTQKRIIRCILGLHPRSSCRPHYKKLGFLTVPSLYCLQLVLFVRRHGSLFPSNKSFYSDTMSITTRTSNDLCIPAHTTSFFEKGPFYKAIKAYNSLPHDIQQIKSTDRFKRAVNSYLQERCFYDFEFTQ